jgi:hypothetical protein
MNSPASRDRELFQRIHEDLVDSFDEELEMEVEDGMLPEWRIPETQAEKDAAKAERRRIFGNFFGCRANSSNCRMGCRDWAQAGGAL